MTVHSLHREASIELHASPEAVDDLVTDLPRMGAWSPEHIGGEWQGGGKVDDRSIGHKLDARARGDGVLLVVMVVVVPSQGTESIL